MHKKEIELLLDVIVLYIIYYFFLWNKKLLVITKYETKNVRPSKYSNSVDMSGASMFWWKLTVVLLTFPSG